MMLEFISSANAQEAAGAAVTGVSVFDGILPLVLMIGVFYFLLIRPQQKKLAKHKEMVGALSRGDKIVTSGGIFATVVKVEDDHLQVDFAENMRVKLDKNSVGVVLNKPETVAKVDAAKPAKNKK